jgi:hypothetical protein
LVFVKVVLFILHSLLFFTFWISVCRTKCSIQVAWASFSYYDDCADVNGLTVGSFSGLLHFLKVESIAPELLWLCTITYPEVFGFEIPGCGACKCMYFAKP